MQERGEEFARWPSARARMTKKTSNKKRQPSPPSLADWEHASTDEEEVSAEEEVEELQLVERRSKNREDGRGGSTSKAITKTLPKKKNHKATPSQRPLKRRYLYLMNPCLANFASRYVS